MTSHRFRREIRLATPITLVLLVLFLFWRILSAKVIAIWHNIPIYFPRGYLRLASAIFLALAILINPIGRHPMIVVALAGAANGIAMISLAFRDILKPQHQHVKNI